MTHRHRAFNLYKYTNNVKEENDLMKTGEIMSEEYCLDRASCYLI